MSGAASIFQRGTVARCPDCGNPVFGSQCIRCRLDVGRSVEIANRNATDMPNGAMVCGECKHVYPAPAGQPKTFGEIRCPKCGDPRGVPDDYPIEEYVERMPTEYVPDIKQVMEREGVPLIPRRPEVGYALQREPAGKFRERMSWWKDFIRWLRVRNEEIEREKKEKEARNGAGPGRSK